MFIRLAILGGVLAWRYLYLIVVFRISPKYRVFENKNKPVLFFIWRQPLIFIKLFDAVPYATANSFRYATSFSTPDSVTAL